MSRFLKCLVLVGIFGQSVMALAGERSLSAIDFGVDCMIHDDHGKMLSELGMIGVSMSGEFVDQKSFAYGDLRIEANLNGPFLAAPEVANPQMKITIFDSKENILASIVSHVTEEFNTAILIPGRHIYVHCDRMKM